MIFVDRHRIPIPEFFSSEDYKQRVSDLKRFYHDSERSQKRYLDFQLPDGFDSHLRDLFHNKCAYCETKISQFEFEQNNKEDVVSKMASTPKIYDGIDHFRPRKNAKNFTIGLTQNVSETTDLEHYWWLSYEWQNLYYCCQNCKKAKGSWFPVKNNRSKIEMPYSKIINSENYLLIDPCIDIIESHFEYNLDTAEIIAKTERAKVTIKLLELNRDDLISKRLNAINEESQNRSLFNDAIDMSQFDKIAQHWNAIFDGNSKDEFIGIRRAFINQSVQNNSTLESSFYSYVPSYFSWKEKLQKEVSSSTTILKPTKKNITDSFDISLLKNVQIEKIVLKNYKCFDHLTIKFLENNQSVNREPWLVFLGENGVGKSSVLKGIAVALMGQKNIDKLNLKGAKFLQYGKRVGYIKLYNNNREDTINVNFNKGKNITSNIENPLSYIIGYGSTRLLPKGKLEPETDVKYVKIKNLFDYSVALSDAKSWLLNVSTKMFNQVAISLKDLLLLDNDDTIRRNKSKNELCIKYLGFKTSTQQTLISY
jgi:5-methylcytosine-specific restriction endonuclease McrA